MKTPSRYTPEIDAQINALRALDRNWDEIGVILFGEKRFGACVAEHARSARLACVGERGDQPPPSNYAARCLSCPQTFQRQLDQPALCRACRDRGVSVTVPEVVRSCLPPIVCAAHESNIS